ncbi:hypothetical protein AVENLUH5627_03411 [Acinetobacter venetianus]|uniref:Uncharacterized protein n=1 Tax=Acinetobacter venetianus TaxID=52133 RepID=A0A150HJ82_9GAMM|nr:hypothetical protein AVENLUH5627_03411 [Acinetobacter venetianus]
MTKSIGLPSVPPVIPPITPVTRSIGLPSVPPVMPPIAPVTVPKTPEPSPLPATTPTKLVTGPSTLKSPSPFKPLRSRTDIAFPEKLIGIVIGVTTFASSPLPLPIP